MTDNWLAVEHKVGWGATRIGSRPGDTFADLIFNFVASRIDRSVASKLREEGLLPVIPCHGTLGVKDGEDIVDNVELMPISFIDDVAACVMQKSKGSLIADIARTSSVIIVTMAEYGLQCNFKAGNSEAMLIFGGPGSRKEAQCAAAFSSIGFESVHFGQLAIRTTRFYKHLGLQLNCTGDCGAEIAMRW